MLTHGGNLHDAINAFGIPREHWLDLSTGINPCGYPVPAVSADAWHRLPEVPGELIAAAMRYYGAPLMLPVAGTQAAIQALPRLRAPSRVTVAAPSYAEHAYHWGQHGHQMRQVPYTELDQAADGSDVMVVCNPNNPTGATVEPERLLAWADALAARGGWLVVDEAFGDVTPHTSVAPYCSRPGLIVLRSIGKFFGLAGLRLGFVAAQPGVLTTLADLLGPWTISGPAQSIGRTALSDEKWQATARVQLQAEGERLQQLLAAHGIASSGCALFQWWPEPRPEAFRTHMAERGIWVRLFPDAARGTRIGLPRSEKEFRRLARALAQWKESDR
jgi:cobalamin biosynthetic protein CobC